MSVLSMKKKAKVLIEILAKYPGEFRPSEHEFAVEVEGALARELHHVFVGDALWGRVERLWSHERGMLLGAG